MSSSRPIDVVFGAGYSGVIAINRLAWSTIPEIMGAGVAVVVPDRVAGHLRMSCAAALPLGCHTAGTVLAALCGQQPTGLSVGFLLQCLRLGRRSGRVQWVRFFATPRPFDMSGRLAAVVEESATAQPRFDVSTGEHDEIVAAFLEACSGDLGRLASLLDPHVVSVSDGEDLVRAARKPVFGAEAVAHYLLNVISAHRRATGEQVTLSLGTINGRTGIVVQEGVTVVTAVDVVIDAGRIARIALQVNPEKLQTKGKWT